MFNWSATFVRSHMGIPEDYREFQQSWELPVNATEDFLEFATKDYNKNEKEEALENKAYLKTILKSEIAGAKWGRDELWGVRIESDNQVMDARKHFNEADAFLANSY
jgi:hypothetical protein